MPAEREPGTDPARDQLERAQGTWVLVVRAGYDTDVRRFAALRRVLRVKSFEAESLRSRLPGPIRRGARVDLLPLLERLREIGIEATLERRGEECPG